MEFRMNRVRESEKEVARKVNEAAAHIRAKMPHRAKIGIILGSGMGEFGGSLSQASEVRNDSVPYYPRSTVQGHSGRIISGKLHNTSLLVFQGRVHFYETGSLESVLFPVRVANRLGIKTLLLTNAAGGVNREFRPADLMLITDQMNLTLENPVPHPRDHVRSSDLYDRKLQDLFRLVAAERHLKLNRGVYCGIKGPSYETAAEVEMIRRLGADAIGMSTVNEVSLAHALGIRVGGVSCITNLATGIAAQRLTHVEVTEVAAQVREPLESLLSGLIEKIARTGHEHPGGSGESTSI
jgi:purine-nucleoside phosphorylase